MIVLSGSGHRITNLPHSLALRSAVHSLAMAEMITPEQKNYRNFAARGFQGVMAGGMGNVRSPTGLYSFTQRSENRLARMKIYSGMTGLGNLSTPMSMERFAVMGLVMGVVVLALTSGKLPGLKGR